MVWCHHALSPPRAGIRPVELKEHWIVFYSPSGLFGTRLLLLQVAFYLQVLSRGIGHSNHIDGVFLSKRFICPRGGLEGKGDGRGV
jgi:hypothetical protein